MSMNIVAKRYAEALFQIGEEKDSLDVLVEQFIHVKDVFVSNADLTPYLKHPRVSKTEKLSFIDNTFSQFETIVINTLKLLVERDRIELTPFIIEQFIEIVNDVKGIAEVTVQSVRELTKKETKSLADSLAKRFDKRTVRIKNVVNPDILGGLHIRIGNTIIDGTISGKLERIERNIASAKKQ